MKMRAFTARCIRCLGILLASLAILTAAVAGASIFDDTVRETNYPVISGNGIARTGTDSTAGAAEGSAAAAGTEAADAAAVSAALDGMGVSAAGTGDAGVAGSFDAAGGTDVPLAGTGDAGAALDGMDVSAAGTEGSPDATAAPEGDAAAALPGEEGFALKPMTGLSAGASEIAAAARAAGSAEESDPVDFVLILDGSGSMAYSDTQSLYLSSAKMFTDMLPAENARLAIVAFGPDYGDGAYQGRRFVEEDNFRNRLVKVFRELDSITDQESKREAKAAIDAAAQASAETSGLTYTPIGYALQTAMDVLAAGDSKPGKAAVILLSDGRVSGQMDGFNGALDYESLDQAADIAAASEWPVYCLELNDDGMNDSTDWRGNIGRHQMRENIPGRTSTEPIELKAPEEAEKAFTEIFARFFNATTSMTTKRETITGGKAVMDFDVDEMVAETNLTLTGQISEVEKFELLQMGGIPETYTVAAGDVDEDLRKVVFEDRYITAKLMMPQAGKWQVTVYGTDGVEIGLYAVSIREMTLNLDVVEDGGTAASSGTELPADGSGEYGAAAGYGTDAYGTAAGYGTYGTDAYGTAGYGYGTDAYGAAAGYGYGTDAYGTAAGYGTDAYGAVGYGYGTDAYGTAGYGYGTDAYGTAAGYGTDAYGAAGYGYGTDAYGAAAGYGYGYGYGYGTDAYGTGYGTDAYGAAVGYGTDAYGAAAGYGTDANGAAAGYGTDAYGVTADAAYGTESAVQPAEAVASDGDPVPGSRVVTAGAGTGFVSTFSYRDHPYTSPAIYQAIPAKLIVEKDGQQVDEVAMTADGGSYTASYVFPSAGQYVLHAEAEYEGFHGGVRSSEEIAFSVEAAPTPTPTVAPEPEPTPTPEPEPEPVDEPLQFSSRVGTAQDANSATVTYDLKLKKFGPPDFLLNLVGISTQKNYELYYTDYFMDPDNPALEGVTFTCEPMTGNSPGIYVASQDAVHAEIALDQKGKAMFTVTADDGEDPSAKKTLLVEINTDYAWAALWQQHWLYIVGIGAALVFLIVILVLFIRNRFFY